ncbi:hypothetical protein BZZ08_06291 [Streptomyces sp. MH60]|nr:hypothetical protein BZZ08_06291 [Streptomyces sp. MH60]
MNPTTTPRTLTRPSPRVLPYGLRARALPGRRPVPLTATATVTPPVPPLRRADTPVSLKDGGAGR